MFVVLLGIIISLFTVKSEKSVEEDFYMNDILEMRESERQIANLTNVSMSEINRISKLLTFFFNDVIVNKKYELAGMSEYFESINTYDMQIVDVKKDAGKFIATVVIATPDSTYDELVYTPYKKYEMIIESTEKGLKVAYINMLQLED
ncbi:MAG: hypothetical protein MJ246_07190 [Clostridia bacterium]|nr:hypothetical protein [Clostridia bacterium]